MLAFEPGIVCKNPIQMKYNGTISEPGMLFTVEISKNNPYVSNDMLYDVAHTFEKELGLRCVEIIGNETE